VLGISALIALPAFSQSNFSNPVNQVNMRLRGTIQNGSSGGNVKDCNRSGCVADRLPSE